MEERTENFVELKVGGELLNPRGPVGLVDDLASIKTQGIITPLVVVELPDGKLGVISGARRLAYARKHSIPTLPYVVRDIPPNDMNTLLKEMLLAQHGQEHPIIVLNKKGDTVGGQALAVWRLLRWWSGNGWEELPTRERSAAALRLAGMFGAKDADHIYCLESLVSAPIETRRAVASGKMAFSAYRRLRTSPELQAAALDAVGEDGVVTVAKARQVKKEEVVVEQQGALTQMRAIMRALLELQDNLENASGVERFYWQEVVRKVTEIGELL